MWRCVCSRCGVCLCVLRRYSSPDPAKFMRCFRIGTSTTDRRPKTRFLFYVLPQALRWRRSLLVAGCLRAVLSLSSLAWHLPLARSSSETLHSHTGVFFVCVQTITYGGCRVVLLFIAPSIINQYKMHTNRKPCLINLLRFLIACSNAIERCWQIL